MKLSASRIALVAVGGALLFSVCGIANAAATAAGETGQRPAALVVTNEPLPPDLQSKIYNTPSRVPDITPSQLIGVPYMDSDGGSETVVGKKVSELRRDLFGLQGKVAALSEKLSGLENQSKLQSADYYASVATISTQLQSGTTPGNPRLIKRLGVARTNLEKLSGNVAALNEVAMEISESASISSFLLESARAAYSLSGGIEEDHIRLAQLEDGVNSTVVVIDRLLNNANDDITRTVSYLNAERENLRTLSLAIETGDLFGKSLASRPFSSAQLASFSPDARAAAETSEPASQKTEKAAAPSNPRPLVKIRFDRTDVAYEQPVYMAVKEALSRYPGARFELVAVHPDSGNAAQVAIESTRSRRNAERVLRSLTQMGVPLDRVDLSYAPSAGASTNEVHLYVR